MRKEQDEGQGPPCLTLLTLCVLATTSQAQSNVVNKTSTIGITIDIKLKN